MPKGIEKITAKAEDLGVKDGRRHLKIDLQADSTLFKEVDFFSLNGAMESIPTALKAGGIKLLDSYLKIGKDLLQEVKRFVVSKETGDPEEPFEGLGHRKNLS